MEAPENYNFGLEILRRQVDTLRQKIIYDLKKQPRFMLEYYMELCDAGHPSTAVNKALSDLLFDRTIVHDYPEDVVGLNLETPDFHYQG
ncbi:MAG: hypothetical protein ACYDAS_03155 [Patescibacteria group bacterium]